MSTGAEIWGTVRRRDTVGHQYHVSRRLAASVTAGGDGEVEAERVLGRPLHFQQRLLVQVVHQAVHAGERRTA